MVRPRRKTGLALTITVTITVSLADPSPTLTEAAVKSAYASYTDLCGPQLARVYQDELAEYNIETGLHVTDITDPGFAQWGNLDSILQTGKDGCQLAQNLLEVDVASLTSTRVPSTMPTATGDSVVTTSTTRTMPTSSTVPTQSKQTEGRRRRDPH
ncbi:hypothetical protein C8R43DRAFT_1136635 [Mycena crocata]|nr:hypothetical protein C8R43DRAFT_1136635 [Mycena crocata]